MLEHSFERWNTRLSVRASLCPCAGTDFATTTGLPEARRGGAVEPLPPAHPEGRVFGRLNAEVAVSFWGNPGHRDGPGEIVRLQVVVGRQRRSRENTRRKDVQRREFFGFGDRRAVAFFPVFLEPWPERSAVDAPAGTLLRSTRHPHVHMVVMHKTISGLHENRLGAVDHPPWPLMFPRPINEQMLQPRCDEHPDDPSLGILKEPFDKVPVALGVEPQGRCPSDGGTVAVIPYKSRSGHGHVRQRVAGKKQEIHVPTAAMRLMPWNLSAAETRKITDDQRRRGRRTREGSRRAYNKGDQPVGAPVLSPVGVVPKDEVITSAIGQPYPPLEPAFGRRPMAAFDRQGDIRKKMRAPGRAPTR